MGWADAIGAFAKSYNSGVIVASNISDRMRQLQQAQCYIKQCRIMGWADAIGAFAKNVTKVALLWHPT